MAKGRLEGRAGRSCFETPRAERAALSTNGHPITIKYRWYHSAACSPSAGIGPRG